MPREKRPVTDNDAPEYPDAAGESLDRRRFFAILGAGAAGALVAGVSGSAQAQRFAPPPPPRDYPDPPPVTLGVPRPPRYQRTRLPASGSRPANLKDDCYLSYVLWVRHDDPEIDRVLRCDARDILSSVDRILYRSIRYWELDDPRKLGQAESRAARKIRRALPRFLRSGLISVNLEIVRRKHVEPLPGVIAPPPYY